MHVDVSKPPLLQRAYLQVAPVLLLYETGDYYSMHTNSLPPSLPPSLPYLRLLNYLRLYPPLAYGVPSISPFLPPLPPLSISLSPSSLSPFSLYSNGTPMTPVAGNLWLVMLAIFTLQPMVINFPSQWGQQAFHVK